MYISVDCYYDIYLKGKDKKAVLEEIEKLRAQIARIKLKMESPSYSVEINPYSTDASDIAQYREYLHTAVSVMKSSFSIPCKDILTESEVADIEFNKNVDNISSVILTMGRYMQYRYELSLSEHTAVLKTEHLNSEVSEKDVDIADARDMLRELHLGEWKEKYTSDCYGYSLSEPTLWKLRVEFRNGIKPFYSEGVGIFPHNFNLLCRLMGVD